MNIRDADKSKAFLKHFGTFISIHEGTGSPEGIVEESPGAIYFNKSGGAGTTLYVKESGINTKTGWVGK